MKVFVSSTYEDLKEYRKAASDAILKMEHQPVMMEHILATTNPPKRECLDRVEESDIFLGIYAYRYGFIPKGDNISITEQEYHHAILKGKEVYCFIIDENFEWPSKLKEDSIQLQDFLSKIKRDYTVKFFKTPKDLEVAVTQVLAKVQQKYMGPWQQKAQKIDNHKKLTIINELIGQNNLGRLNDEAMKATTKLIASDFGSMGPSTALKLIDYTGELLDGNIRLEQFTYFANQLSGDTAIRQRWFKKIQRSIRPFILPVIIFMFIGLFIGIFSYIQNWFGVRSAYLAARNAEKIDVVNWLVNQSRKNLVLSSTSEMNKEISLTALRFAYELDPNSAKIKEYLDQLLENTRVFTRDPDAQLNILIKNRILLEQYYESVHYPIFLAEAESLRSREDRIVYSNAARAIFANLKKQMHNPTVNHETLLQDCRNLLSNYPNYEKADSIRYTLVDLQKDSVCFAAQLAIQDCDTLTIVEKGNTWKNFSPSKIVSYESEYKSKMTRHLDSLMTNFAYIDDPSKFVTCDSVVNRQPRRIKEYFAIGAVWAWAQVYSPGNEKVTFKWYTKKQKFEETQGQVGKSLKPGYRIYFWRSYGADKKGRNEVRLYNSQNLLIGRKVFFVR